MAAKDIVYEIVIANPTAKCPFCPASVVVIERKDGSLRTDKECRHCYGAERKFKVIICKFLRTPKEK